MCILRQRKCNFFCCQVALGKIHTHRVCINRKSEVQISAPMSLVANNWVTLTWLIFIFLFIDKNHLSRVFSSMSKFFFPTITKICSKVFMFISVQHVSRIFFCTNVSCFMFKRKICFHYFFIFINGCLTFFIYQVRIFWSV